MGRRLFYTFVLTTTIQLFSKDKKGERAGWNEKGIRKYNSRICNSIISFLFLSLILFVKECSSLQKRNLTIGRERECV